MNYINLGISINNELAAIVRHIKPEYRAKISEIANSSTDLEELICSLDSNGFDVEWIPTVDDVLYF